MSLEAYKDYLKADGWTEGRVNRDCDKFDAVWYAKEHGAPRCRCNEDKPLQLMLKVWDFRPYGKAMISLEVEMRAELPNGRWITIEAGSIDAAAVTHQLPSAVADVLAGWKGAHAFALTNMPAAEANG